MKLWRVLCIVVLALALTAPILAQDGGDEFTTEQPSVDNLRVYTDIIDAVVLPILAFIARAVNSITNVQILACGQVDAAFVPFGTASAPVQLTSANSFPETMRGIGQSMGAPVSYMRAIAARYDIEYGPLTLVVGFILAGITFEVIVIILVYTMRAALAVVSFFVEIYRLIPFKSS